MKPVRTVRFEKFIYGVKLYRDDIEELLFKLQNKSLKVEISDDENVYVSIDEVIKYKGHFPSKLNIIGTIDNFNLISFNLSIDKRFIYLTTDGSSALVSFGYEIEVFLKNRIPWQYKIFQPVIWLWPIWIVSFFVFFVRQKLLSNYQWLIWVFALLFIIFLASALYNQFYKVINLSRKHEVGFFKRNLEKIILGSIMLLIGAIITLFIQWIKGRI